MRPRADSSTSFRTEELQTIREVSSPQHPPQSRSLLGDQEVTRDGTNRSARRGPQSDPHPRGRIGSSRVRCHEAWTSSLSTSANS
jgi:hypothetical protein